MSRLADLDVSHLRHFLYPVLLRRKIAQQLLPPPGKIAQFDDLSIRQKAPFQKSMPVQVSQILRVPEIGLVAAFRFVLPCAHQLVQPSSSATGRVSPVPERWRRTPVSSPHHLRRLDPR